MVSCDSVTVWVDNNFRERLARLTFVFNVSRVTKRGPGGAAQKRSGAAARSSRFIGSPLHCRLILVMRCKQRYLLRAKRSVRPRAKLRACRN